jgi:PAS domain S-box-containing protein
VIANGSESDFSRKARSGLRILLVEDCRSDIDLCVHLLRKTYPESRCDVVESPAEFSRLIRTTYYDIILADYNLPSWTGVAAFNLMRKSGRSFPFILVTGVLTDSKAAECIKSGITDYILKGHLERLPVTIARTLEEKELLDQHNRLAQALRVSREKCQFLAETTSAATFIEEAELGAYVNSAAERITGYGRAELSELKFWNLVLPASKKAVLGSPAEDLEGGGLARRYEIQIRTRQNKERWLDATVGAYTAHKDAIALITAFDITDRKHAEAEVYRLADVLGGS